jgi:hypothetical protein
MEKILKKINEYLDALMAGIVALSVAGVLSVENIKALVAGVLAVVLTNYAKKKSGAKKQALQDIVDAQVAELVVKKAPVKRAVKKVVTE